MNLRLLMPGLWAALLACTPPLEAAVNDIFPTDYFALTPGVTVLTLYGYDRAQSGPYSQGTKTLDGGLDSQVLTARITKAFKVSDTTVAATAVLPWVRGQVTPAALAAALTGGQGDGISGYMDLRLGVTAWLVNDKQTANYAALGAMVIAPTGSYDNRRLLNPGENRWKYVLSAGWQKDITPKWVFELAPEIAWHGDNPDYPGQRRLSQHSSWALTSYLRYRAGSFWHIHMGGQINRGGTTELNGVDQRNPANNNRIMAGVTFILPEMQQVAVRFAKDNCLDNGFRTDRELALRYQKTF